METINNKKMSIQEVAAVIDRSGSMRGKEEDTIGGINATIDELKKNNEPNTKINFSVKFFDHEEYMLLRRTPLENIRPLKIGDLQPRGQTALLDAMGSTLTYFIHLKMTEPDSFNSCIIYVATDGMENASKRYTTSSIKNIIAEAKKYNIDLLYLGANQDAILEAEKFGLDAGRAINYSETRDNVEAVYRSAAHSARRQRTGSSVDFLPTERHASQV